MLSVKIYDDFHIEDGLAESFDGGKTWERAKLVYDEEAGIWQREQPTPNDDE